MSLANETTITPNADATKVGATGKKEKKAKVTNRIPNSLAYTRSLLPTLATMFGVDKDGVDVPVEVYEQTVTGAQGAYKNGYSGDMQPPKEAEPEANVDDPNPKKTHKATLPLGCSRLEIRFGVVVEPNSLAPSNCAQHSIYDELIRFGELAGEKGVVRDLAGRYAWNLVNGRAVWNNGNMEDMTTRVVAKGFDETFDSYSYPLEAYPGIREGDDKFVRLVEVLENALRRKGRGSTVLHVTVGGGLPEGAELWPSQVFVPKTERNREHTDNSRVLSSRPARHGGKTIQQAVMTSQKIGNALRTIDEWHDRFGEIGIVPVELYGFSRKRLTTVRKSHREGAIALDAFSYLANLNDLVGELEAGTVSDGSRYLAAVLIRGGVFSAGASDK